MANLQNASDYEAAANQDAVSVFAGELYTHAVEEFGCDSDCAKKCTNSNKFDVAGMFNCLDN